jgi:cytochrome c peroxidase
MRKVVISGILFCVVVICYSFLPVVKTGPKYSFKGAPKTIAQLGEVLFFEKLLSSDSSRSCSSCHIPEFAFADTVAFSRGVGNRSGRRNAPSCANMNDRPYFFYDGRAGTLEQQVKFPIEDKNEMNIPIEQVVARLKRNRQYTAWFKQMFKSGPNEQNLEIAIAAYERTLETSKTPFDRYMVKNDTSVISAAALRGRELFMVKARCFECHFSPDFTGDEFKNIGLFDGKKYNDSGRYLITRNMSDLGKFKVPGLRNVAVTGPYMHNGMFKTLKEVIDYYDNPYNVVANPVNMDSTTAMPLNLSSREKADLEEFLISLTDDRFKRM